VLSQLTSQAAFDAAGGGWFNAGNNLILTKTGSQSTATAKTVAFSLNILAPVLVTFVCNNGATTWGQSVYASGNISALGNWAPGQAFKLTPNGPYPAWTGTIGVPPNTAVQWKCIKRPENADDPVVWQPGANNAFKAPASGDVTTTGDFDTRGTVTEQFICDNGVTVWGQSVYVVGSIPALGNWDPTQALKLDPTNYPRWTGAFSNLPASTPVQWKCIKQGVGAVVWQPDPNNGFTSPPVGQVGTTSGAF